MKLATQCEKSPRDSVITEGKAEFLATWTGFPGALVPSQCPALIEPGYDSLHPGEKESGDDAEVDGVIARRAPATRRQVGNRMVMVDGPESADPASFQRSRPAQEIRCCSPSTSTAIHLRCRLPQAVGAPRHGTGSQHR